MSTPTLTINLTNDEVLTAYYDEGCGVSYGLKGDTCCPCEALIPKIAAARPDLSPLDLQYKVMEVLQEVTKWLERIVDFEEAWNDLHSEPDWEAVARERRMKGEVA